MLTHRERVLRAFRFEPTDRVPYDLIEGRVWPELMTYFAQAHGLRNEEQVIDYLDVDCRWVYDEYQGPPPRLPANDLPDGWESTYSDTVYKRPLANAHTLADLHAYNWPSPTGWVSPDFAAARRRWPDHALVYMVLEPLFCAACDLFGMEEALARMSAEPVVFEACISTICERTMRSLDRTLNAAAGLCDICTLWDDYASQRSLLMSPNMWRRLIKPYLKKIVGLIRSRGVLCLFHSCGAVRPILRDLIEIGVNGLEVFQTSAAGMDAISVAREFGGQLVFYGGVDAQHLLTHGTPEQVKAAVHHNAKAFAGCGGYVVANCHWGIANIQGQNIEAMCEAARATAQALQ